MKHLIGQLAKARVQFEATPWLRWAALAIAVLAMAFVWQALDGIRVRAQEQAIDEESKLRRVRALEGQEGWLSNEREAAQLLASLNAQLPVVATSGLAQAALQRWLREMSSRFSTEQAIRIAIEDAAEVDGLTDVVKVRATFSGALSPTEVLGIIRQIESAPSLMVIETININNDTSNTVNLSLNAYFSVDTSASQP